MHLRRHSRVTPSQQTGDTVRRVVSVVAAAAVTFALPSIASAAPLEPDDSFSGNGRASLNVRGYDQSSDVVIDGTSSYLVGTTQKSRDDACAFMVAKYNASGSLVRSFGSRGKRVLTIGRESCALSGALTQDGGVLVAGWSVSRRLSVVVVKLRPSGALDRTFSGDGLLKIPVSQGVDWPLVESSPDGSIWLAWGAVRGYDYDAHVSDFRVMHFSSRGRVDRSFSGDGSKMFDVARRDYPYFSTVDADGRFYLTGYGTRSSKTAGAASLLSISANGRSYQRNVRPWGARGSLPLTVDVAADGQVVLGLTPWKDAGWGAARFSPTLDRDPTYGRDGYAKHSCRCYSSAGTLTPDGLVLVGGTQNKQARTAVARFTLDGHWDQTVGTRWVDLFSGWEYWVEAETDAAGRVVMVGTAKTRTVDAVIARLVAV